MLDAKQVKAKLWNLRSSIEGMVPLIDAGVLQPENVADAVAAVAAKFMDDVKPKVESD